MGRMGGGVGLFSTKLWIEVNIQIFFISLMILVFVVQYMEEIFSI